MTTPSPQPPAPSTGDTPSPVPPPNQAPQKPWRTEGLPPRQPEKPRLRRSTIAVWLVGYLLLFGVLTVQDRLAGPQAVPYTEFRNQVTNKNVGALFARGNSIQGELKKAAALPDKQGETYQRFSTERPTFATDDLLTELTDGGATVRATPLVEQRGFFTNLLISFAPILLLVAFYLWMFRRQQGAMGGLLGGVLIQRPSVSISMTSPGSTRWRQKSTKSSIF